MPLLAAGAVAVILAQIGLYFSVELNTRAPMGYLLLLALGVILFTLGSIGLSRSSSRDDKVTPEPFPKPTLAPTANLRTRYGAIGLILGVTLMVLLLALLVRGWESGTALFIWMAALSGIAAAFCPPNVTAAVVSNAALTQWIRKHRWDVLAVCLLSGIFLAVNLSDLQHWYYSAIGDEYLFFEHAKRIIEEGITRPFSQEGVYNKHPVLTSVYQATVMRVFGADYFGWTFSETLNAALTIPAIYLLGRCLGGRSAGVIAAGVFAFSHYILAFSHTGYNNLSSLPVTSWALALFLIGWRNGNPLLLYAAGIIAGLGFYTHYSGRAVVPIIALFVLTQGYPRRLLHLWPLALGLVLTVAPTFAVEQAEVISRMFGQVVGGYSEVVTGSIGQRLLTNIELNLQAFSYSSTVHTYVYGPLMDPVSGALATLGLAFASGQARRFEFRLLLVWFSVGMLMTGVLSPYPHVAVTRLLFVVPPLALMAGLLANELLNNLSGSWVRVTGLPNSSLVASTLFVLLSTSLVLNLWQFWQVTPQVMPHSQEAVALGAFRSPWCAGDADGTVLVGHATGEGNLMYRVLEAFQPSGAMPRHLNHHQLTENRDVPGAPPKCVIFINPRAPEAVGLQEELWRRYPEGQLESFTNQSGTTSVDVFSRRFAN